MIRYYKRAWDKSLCEDYEAKAESKDDAYLVHYENVPSALSR